MVKKGKLGKFLALICTALAGVMIFSLAACNDGDDKDALTLNKSTVSVAVGGAEQISVTSSTTENIEWTIDKTSVATVKGSGAGNKLCTVTGVAAGTATVTAKAGDKTATCAVTVTGSSAAETVEIKLNGAAVGTDAYNLYGAGDELTFTATASKGSAITWESSATGIATVANGKVTAVAAGDATITAKVSDSVKATVKVKVLAGTEIQFNDNPVDGWSYWEGIRYQDNGNGDVKTAVSYGESAAKITYDAPEPGTPNGAIPWTIQLRYNSAQYTGSIHDVTLTVVGSETGNIMINQKVVEVVANVPQTVTIEGYSEQGLYVQFGVSDGVDGYDKSVLSGTNVQFTFSDIKFTSKVIADLVAPTGLSINDERKIVTFTDNANDAANVGKYELGFFANDTATEPVKTLDVVSGNAVNLASIPGGSYVLRIRAIQKDVTIRSSAWSEATVSITFQNDRTDLLNNQFVAGSWAYYIEGSHEDAYLDADGNVVVKNLQANNGGNWWGTQIFYTPESGKTITGASFTITAKQAGFITAHVEDTAHVYELKEDNQYTVTVNVTGLNISGNAAFKIFMCKWNDNTGRLNGDITISNIEFTYAN